MFAWLRKRKSPVLKAPDPPHWQIREPEKTGIEVEEIDTSEMTRTGVHRTWSRLRGGTNGGED
jgi:hypothetical protein